jgi:hypothetical protein
MGIMTPDGRQFEIPDDWWAFAEMHAFASEGRRCYPVDPEQPGGSRVELVPTASVEPPSRNPGIAPFKKAKLMPLLFALRAGNCLPPIKVCRPGVDGRFRYRVCDGFHRYYASVAVGYAQLPVVDHGKCEE